ncbi:MAG: hypothetical protein ACLFS4_08655, partial [Opitutales bacterium]
TPGSVVPPPPGNNTCSALVKRMLNRPRKNRRHQNRVASGRKPKIHAIHACDQASAAIDEVKFRQEARGHRLRRFSDG